MLAGAAAATLDIGVQMLHYYERKGHIPAPPRTQSGYRTYPPELVERVRFIRKAQAFGLTLNEVREILRLAEIGASPCGRALSRGRRSRNAADAQTSRGIEADRRTRT